LHNIPNSTENLLTTLSPSVFPLLDVSYLFYSLLCNYQFTGMAGAGQVQEVTGYISAINSGRYI